MKVYIIGANTEEEQYWFIYKYLPAPMAYEFTLAREITNLDSMLELYTNMVETFGGQLVDNNFIDFFSQYVNLKA